MIIDKLENIGKYACLGQNFATAAKFILDTDIAALPLGRADVDEKNVYEMRQCNQLSHGEPAWEAHEKYADIQLVIDGNERFMYGFNPVYNPINPETDFRTCQASGDVDFVLTAGEFVIFLPGEAHAPNLYGEKGDTVNKLVVKVKM